MDQVRRDGDASGRPRARARPAASIRDRRPATRSQPGTNSEDRPHDDDGDRWHEPGERQRRRERHAGEEGAAGSAGSSAADHTTRTLDWPPMPRVSERARSNLAGRRGVRRRLHSRCAPRGLRDLTDPIDAAIIAAGASPGASRCAESAGPGHRARLDVGGDRRWRDRPAGGLAERPTTRWGGRCADDRHRRADHRDSSSAHRARQRRTSSSRSSSAVGYSFPSGHTANATIAYGVLGVLVARLPWPTAIRVAIEVVLGAIVFGVGLSRVWLGVHYPTDVVAGWLLGGAIVLIYAALTLPASPAPAEGAVDADPAARRSDRPAAG